MSQKRPKHTQQFKYKKKTSFSFNIQLICIIFCNFSNANIWRSETLYLIKSRASGGGGDGTMENSNIEITTQVTNRAQNCRTQSKPTTFKSKLAEALCGERQQRTCGTRTRQTRPLVIFFAKTFVVYFFSLCCRYRCYIPPSSSWPWRRVACSALSVGML